MEKKTMKDMTSGSPMKLILGFLIPMLFGLLFQQFYNMMDTIIVGKYLVCRRSGSWFYRLGQFYDHWFLYGSLQWVCHSGSSEIW